MEWIKILFLIGMLKICLLGMATGQKNVITLNDGGYSNVLIAIDRKVPEDMTIIKNIKTMFTSASQCLYNASRNHVYWKHIKILVPNTWSNPSRFKRFRTESFHSANIIVHHFPDDEPYVENLEGCGKGALSLMHLTPKYILNQRYREDKFGDTDNVLVRSWGYYRWGLFKENYDGKGVGTAPTKKDCHFFDTESEQTAETSLLSATRKDHVPSVEVFCAEDSLPDSVHNPLAVNLMNINCGGDSAWKVMLDRTTDFRNGISLISNTTPKFEVLQVSLVRSVVLVLDISGSMGARMGGNRLTRMNQSSAHYIMNIIPENSKLGIVIFSNETAVRASLTDITDTASRKGLVNNLPTEVIGGTCIGCGILKGIEVLGSYAEGGYLLLISDGDEKLRKYINQTYDEIEKAGVIIDTITISNATDPKMEDLSTRTSGLSSFCLDTGTGTCLQQAFQRTIAERPDIGTETVPTQVH
ncbi:calcium-activated chloride channel regulator 1-like [Lytechinus pictus]|uniref:calcium-activated chloride channel regulator 1-like n=1 Tax=Lytechinus pictus TaxID=7653 RepID=UPI0030BA0240